MIAPARTRICPEPVPVIISVGARAGGQSGFDPVSVIAAKVPYLISDRSRIAVIGHVEAVGADFSEGPMIVTDRVDCFRITVVAIATGAGHCGQGARHRPYSDHSGCHQNGQSKKAGRAPRPSADRIGVKPLKHP